MGFDTSKTLALFFIPKFLVNNINREEQLVWGNIKKRKSQLLV